MTKFEIENARETIENCEKCGIARQYADIDETMLCKEHYEIFSDIEGKITVTTPEDTIEDDVFNDNEIEEWYRARAVTFTFHSFAPYCSMCFRDNPSYVGITENGTPFEFCRKCRDELIRKKDEMLASPERFGV
jgi:hypothetical protein